MLSAGCGARRPDVILISLDTVRADHLSVYGYHRPTTPNLERLGQQGVVFEQAFAQVPWTVASHMSLLTSLYPTVHGVAHEKRRADIPRMLTEELRASGYRTAGFVAPILDEAYGFGNGFDHYFRAAQERVAESMVDRVLRWLADPGSRPPPPRPLFLFLHLYDAHYTYSPPPPHDTAFIRSYDPDIQKIIHAHPYAQSKALSAEHLAQAIALYDAEIRYVDLQLGRLFAGLKRHGLYDSSLIVVLSDHGEGFLEHGLMNHGNSAYEELIRVPLLLRLPGGRFAGRRVKDVVQLIDVAPTVLESAGAGALPDAQGASLLPLLEGKRRADPPRPAFVSGAYTWALRGDDWKLVENPPERFATIPRSQKARHELYDLRNDPAEKTNLAAVRAAVVEKMAQALQRIDQGNRELRRRLAAGREEKTLELTDEQRERLRGLGYIE